MRKHPIRKFLGLTVLYSVVIIGIFVLQFKSESVISKNLGSLRISLAQTESDSNTTKLKNQMRSSFKGLNLNASDETPIMVYNKKGTESRKLVLENWAQPTENSAQFLFDDGSSLTLEVSGSGKQEMLSARVILSSDWHRISIPYTTSGSYTVKEQTENKLMISSRDSNWSLSAPHITESTISFTKDERIATYQFFDPTKRYDFSTAVAVNGADAKTYEQNLRMIRDSLVRAGQDALNSAQSYSLTEAEIVSYVAEMTKNGRYDSAINSIPDSFKKGNRRTYVSSPYFDNLVTMNKSLIIQTDRFKQMVDSALETKDLNIFAIDGIADYILREKFTSKIQSLLSIPAEMAKFEPTLSQATAILNVWTLLQPKDSALAGLLDKPLTKCLEVIADNCIYESSSLTLRQTEDSSGIVETVRTAQSLIFAGRIMERQDLTQSGQLMINTLLSSDPVLDIHTLSALYPIMVRDNPYYPHTQILGYYGSVPVWAWTCATKISYQVESSGTVDINIDFPQGWTHYVLFNGVPTFHANIEIQKQKFRTDPRFETYNSSGYVYQSGSETLFIKSRHKSQIELIRLFCDPTGRFRPADTNIQVQ